MITNWNVCEGWIKGYLQHDPSKKGIFPKNYIRKFDKTNISNKIIYI